MNHPCPIRFALVLATSVLPNAAAAQDDGWRTIEFETSEVTTPDVAVSPDGEWLIFTMLGHLFRLPVEGGDAAGNAKPHASLVSRSPEDCLRVCPRRAIYNLDTLSSSKNEDS